jgi:hypothetical protein
MNKKSGTAGTPVEPASPIAAQEADVADPGEVTEIKAEQRQLKSGKYGSIKVKPHQPPGAEFSVSEAVTEEPKEKKTSWIEIELVGEDDKPIPGGKYKITLPDATVDEGTLDQNGFARVEGFEKGQCKITFPDLDQDAWEFISCR